MQLINTVAMGGWEKRRGRARAFGIVFVRANGTGRLAWIVPSWKMYPLPLFVSRFTRGNRDHPGTRSRCPERWGKSSRRSPKSGPRRTRVSAARVLCDRGSTEKPVSLAEDPLALARSLPSLPFCSARRTEYESYAAGFNRRRGTPSTPRVRA